MQSGLVLAGNLDGQAVRAGGLRVSRDARSQSHLTAHVHWQSKTLSAWCLALHVSGFGYAPLPINFM